jgi:hypothetical protein
LVGLDRGNGLRLTPAVLPDEVGVLVVGVGWLMPFT